MVKCPECAIEVQPDWDWCHGCGWDPEGLRPPGVALPVAPASRAATPGIAAGPGPALAGDGAAPLRAAAPRRPSSAGRTLVLVLVGGGVGLVGLAVVSILAVTFLGTSADSRFSSIDTAVADGSPAAPAAPGAGVAPVGGADAGDANADANGDAVSTAWNPWTSPDGSYRIDFPVTPVVAPVDASMPNVSASEQAVADLGSVVYSSTAYQLAPDLVGDDPGALLRSVVDSAASGGAFVVTTTEAGTFASSPSLSFRGAVPGGTADGVVFISGTRAFALLALSSGGAPADTGRFFDSFVLAPAP